MFQRAVAVLLLTGFITQPTAAHSQPPHFAIWFDCVYRNPQYPGQATAAISYVYEGSENITAEDYQMFGDTSIGETITAPFVVEPGEHIRRIRVNVGALKVVTLKVVLFARLYVVTVYDHPEYLDCPWEVQPTPIAPAMGTWGDA